MLAARIKELRLLNQMTMLQLGELVHVAESTVSLYESGKRQPSYDILHKFAKIFKVSIDYLLGNTDDPTPANKKNAPALTNEDKRDIAKDLDGFMRSLEGEDTLMFDGEPLDDESKAAIKAAMQVGLEMVKAKNKARFTPKKYRRGSNDEK